MVFNTVRDGTDLVGGVRASWAEGCMRADVCLKLEVVGQPY